eukprot:m.139262 g.139262  ORF g.139262 m.139262 type:complete len:900 (-) comp20301_c0_seq1:77-2776(-)
MEDSDRLNIWLSKNITRQDAERALADQPNGVYLVRRSVSAPGDYVISVAVDGNVQHHQIKHNKGRMITLSGRTLRSLNELIAYYKTTTDGLPVKLRAGVDIYDPQPAPPPRDYYGGGGGSSAHCPAPAPPKPPRTAASGSRAVPQVPLESRYELDGNIHDYEDAENPRPSLPTPPSVVPSSPRDTLRMFELPRDSLRIVSSVGSGQYGQVYEAWLQQPDKEGQLVAVKSCKEMGTPELKENFVSEACTLLQFNHTNVLSLLGVVTESEPLLIILEYVTYGDVKAVLKSCRSRGIDVFPTELMYMAQQTAAGMEHLVSKKFVHRDLAARNILLSHYCVVKIADFGLSRQLEDESQYYRVQSKQMLPFKWMAVECFNTRTFTTASDVWAFGVVLWEIFTLGKTPFKKLNTKQVMQKVRDGERLPAPANCSPELHGIMQRCWLSDPKSRPTFTTLKGELSKLLEDERQRHPNPYRDIGALVQETPAQGDEEAAAHSSWEMNRDDLRYVNDLGEGEFGMVVQMELVSGTSAAPRKMVAVKMLKEDATSEAQRAFQQEIEALTKNDFKHKNVVPLLGVCTSELPHLLVMEYMNMGDLGSYLETCAPRGLAPPALEVKDLVNISEQIACGAAYLASKQFVHRDLAARNCLVGTGLVVKLSDFGLARMLSGTSYYRTKGGNMPVRWMAPEALLYGKFTEKSDVYSYGVTLFEVFSFGGFPYEDVDSMDVIKGKMEGTLAPLEAPEGSPPEIAQIMDLCFTADVEARPTMSTIHGHAATFLQKVLSRKEGYEVLSSPLGTGVLRAGWLTKQGGGESTFGRTSWKRRWFVLRSNGVMTYHKSDKPKDVALGSMDIKQAQKVQEETLFDSSFADNCCFSIQMPSRKYNLVSDTKDDYTGWHAALTGKFA